MDGGAWWATVHGVMRSRTRLHEVSVGVSKHLWVTYLPPYVMRGSGQTSVNNENLPRSSYHSKHLYHLQHHHHYHHRLFLKIVLYKALSFFDIQYRLSQVSINAA